MSNNKTLKHCLKIQLRVIGALLMREVITRYGRHNIGFLWLFVEPMLFTLGVTTLWSIAGFHTSNIPIAAFALTGYSSVLLWRNMPGHCCGAIEPNLALMYHHHVKVFDIFATRILLEIAGATASFITLGIVFTSIGLINPPEDILKVMFGWIMIAWFGGALALLVGSLTSRTEIVEKLWHPVSYLMFPLSGAAFLVEFLPDLLQKVVLFFPMAHGVELLREGYFGSSFRPHYDMTYMAIANLCITLLGFSQERVVSRSVVPE